MATTAVKKSNAAKPAPRAKKSEAVTAPPSNDKATGVESKAAKNENKSAKRVAQAGLNNKSAAKSKDKLKKPKMVRDSFTMPENEYKVLGDVKRACLKAGMEVKKSELLRVGVELIRQMDVERLKGVLATLTPLKAGRPKQQK